MTRPAKQDGHDRSSRYRSNKHRQGMRLLRIWVADPRAPGFGDQARRQAALLREAPEEAEALGLIEKLVDWNDEG